MGRRRRALGVIDQALSSLSNVGIAVVAARGLSPRGFGGFAVAMAIYAFAVGVARALATEPLLVRGGPATLGSGAEAAGAMTTLGLVAAGVCALGGVGLGGTAGRSLLALAPFLPMLLLQDAWRYVAFAADRPADALRVDVVWVGVQVGASGLLVLSGANDPALFVVAWGAAGTAAAVAGTVWARLWPSLRSGPRWIAAHRDLGGPFTAEFLVAGGAANAGLWVLGALSGLGAAGALRAGQTLFGPINIIYVGMLLTLVPQGARRLREDRPGVRPLMFRVSAAIAAVALLWTAALGILPMAAGRAILGDTWPQARPLLLPLGLAMTAGGLAVGPTAGLRSIGAARVALRARLFTLPAAILLPIAGAILADEVGFAVGFAVATWIAAGAWWVIFTRTLAGMVDAAGEVAGAAEHSV